MAKIVEDSIWSNIFKRRGDEVPEDITETLRKVPIFSELSNKELEKVGYISHMREYDDEEIIFHESQPGAGMYMIRIGKVRIVHKTATGDDQELTILSDGDFFGDVGLLDNSPRTAAAISMGKSQIIGLFRPEILKLIDKDPKLGCKILLKLARGIAARLRHANRQLKKATRLEPQAAAAATVTTAATADFDSDDSGDDHIQPQRPPEVQKSGGKL